MLIRSDVAFPSIGFQPGMLSVSEFPCNPFPNVAGPTPGGCAQSAQTLGGIFDFTGGFLSGATLLPLAVSGLVLWAVLGSPAARQRRSALSEAKREYREKVSGIKRKYSRSARLRSPGGID